MKMYFLFCWFMTISIGVLAQDVLPGAGALGYLEHKNGNVDHVTGMFHYNVPLWTLSSGDTGIPVILSYTASGVREGDKPGSVGYNWTLLSGGVVSRVCRGTADERRSDFLFESPDAGVTGTTDWTEWGKKVCRQEVDGENDIFTAVFGNRRVHFMVFRKIGGEMEVVPFEKTNVRIEVQYSSADITGWTVTDESGVKYTYQVAEWTTRVPQNENISYKPKGEISFISSWYLSKIEIPNGDPIVYEYRKEYRPNVPSDTTGIRIDHYAVKDVYRYQYGKSLAEYPFRFEEYKPQYESFLKEANQLEGGHLFLLQDLNQAGYAFQQESSNYLLSPSSASSGGSTVTDRISDRRMMGMTVNFRSVVSAANNLLVTFDKIHNHYTSNVPTRLKLLLSRNVLSACMREKELVNARDEEEGREIIIPAVQLKRVSCGDKEIVAEYDKGGTRITALVYRDLWHGEIDRVELESDGLLRKISWIDRENKCYRYLGFEYFEKPYTSLVFDFWRYPNGGIQEDVDPFRTNRAPDIEYARLKVLSKIRTFTGGRIEIDYENNVCAPQYYKLPDLHADSLYGGIRVKRILLNDGRGGVDTILYRYPEPGIPMYEELSPFFRIHYNGFMDFGRRLNIAQSGDLLINSSNNGLYYPYVEETFIGKGTHNYLFYVPRPRKETSPNSVSYAYWLYGLPLAEGVYDAKGNLLQTKKYLYYTDMSQRGIADGMWDFYGTGWFKQGDAAFNCKQVRQVKAYRYYIDPTGAEKYFDDQLEVKGVFSPKKDVYSVNIEPRTGVYSPEYIYMMSYGGLLVPYKTETTVFSGEVSTRVSLEHLRRKVTVGKQMAQVKEYCYENPSLIFGATGVKTVTSQGDTLKVDRFTPLDFRLGVNNVIDRMKSANVISPVIREQVLIRKKGENRYHLLRENVTEILPFTGTDGNYVFLPARERYYAGTELPIVPETRLISSVYSCSPEDYRDEFKSTYQKYNNSYLPELIEIPGKRELCLYDQVRNSLILTATGEFPGTIAAVDCRRIIPGKTGMSASMKRFYGTTLSTELEVQASSNPGKYRVWLLINPFRNTIKIHYTVAGKALTTGDIPVQVGRWQVVSCDIDLTSIPSADLLRVVLPVEDDAAAMVVAREYAVFEMTSWDAVGRVFARFNQNKVLELLEYDAAGRLSGSYDNRGVKMKGQVYELNL